MDGRQKENRRKVPPPNAGRVSPLPSTTEGDRNKKTSRDRSLQKEDGYAAADGLPGLAEGAGDYIVVAVFKERERHAGGGDGNAEARHGQERARVLGPDGREGKGVLEGGGK